jgi:hypothetical protein
MRLVRLTTENNNCFFESIFNSDLTIKPFSKVALASFTTQLDNLNMVIDSQNNEISYSVEGGGFIKTLTLPNGTYTSSTVQDFWIEVTKLFNQSMQDRRLRVNRQWGCGIVNGRADFKCLYGEVIAPTTFTSTGLIVAKNLVSGGSTRTYKRDPALAPTIGNNSFMYFKSTNNKGCSILRATIYADVSTGVASGFVMGYTASNPIAETEEINPANYLYAIRYVDSSVISPGPPPITKYYRFIINGVETGSTVQAKVGDTLQILTQGGSIKFNIFRSNSGVVELIYETIYNHQTELYPLCMFIGKDTVISNIQFTSDPFYNINNNHGGEEIDDNILTYKIPTTKIPTQCFIQFNSPDLATILGYNKSRYPDAGYNTDAEPDFIADKAFTLRDYSESYIIELLNIKINSMDALSHGERSILYVIPQLSAIKEHVVFEAPQLIFLNINNNFDLNLREIKARVLKDDLSQFRCYGLSTIVMIIKDKDEI